MTDLSADDELIGEFVVEGREAIDVVDEALLTLENSPDDVGLVGEIFRRIHSVKGAAGFLELKQMEGLSHSGESLLARVRDRELPFNESIATALLELMDVLRTLFSELESSGSEGNGNYDPLVARMDALRTGEAIPADDAPAATTNAPEATSEAPTEADPAIAHLDGAGTDRSRNLIGRLLVEAELISEAQLQTALAAQQGGDGRRLGEVLDSLGYVKSADIEKCIRPQIEGLAAEQPETPAKSGRTAAESSVRVDIDLLDGIVGLVGELVLTRNQIMQAADGDAKDLGRRTSELAYITSALQEQALRTRMQRVENAWRSLPRVLRDVSNVAKKKAALEMTGEGIELDRTIIESIRDPLVHLVRNAVDHGLESPEDRVAAGKPEKGTVRLSAIQDGGHVIIEVADDGRGIDPEKIASAAIAKKLVTEADVAAMSQAEKTSLILTPGFSMAREVTKISGRGVGMDVVASNIKEIRGSLEIASEPGSGTTIRLSIPLTLAIVPALVVTCADEVFAVPQASVVELVRLQGDDLEERIDWIHSAPVLQLRDQLLPLIEMTDILELPRVEDRTAVTIIVVQSGDQPFGLVVDRVTKAEEIVVKPVSGEVQAVGVYAGATVMGDGSAALILDVTAIARSTNLASTSTGADRSRTAPPPPPSHLEAILTVSVGERRVGLATTELERLEKVDTAAVEWSGAEAVVQYRGRLLPLVFLSEVLDNKPPCLTDGPLRVVVTSENAATSIGLVVDQVLDVVDIDPRDADRLGSAGRVGVVGSIVAANHLTELLDVPALIELVDVGPLSPKNSVEIDPAPSHDAIDSAA